MAIWSLSFVKRSKMAEMDHLAHPKKSGIFETFGQNFPIQSMEEGNTLHFLSKSAKNKIFVRTPPPTALTCQEYIWVISRQSESVCDVELISFT